MHLRFRVANQCIRIRRRCFFVRVQAGLQQLQELFFFRHGFLGREKRGGLEENRHTCCENKRQITHPLKQFLGHGSLILLLRRRGRHSHTRWVGCMKKIRQRFFQDSILFCCSVSFNSSFSLTWRPTTTRM